jgi:hypothetical protein
LSSRKRKQKHGLVGAAPKTEKELVEHGVPLRFRKTSSGETFLRYFCVFLCCFVFRNVQLPQIFSQEVTIWVCFRFCGYVHPGDEDAEGHDALVVFISALGLHTLQNSEEIFMDGTFKTCPNPFQQILFIHGKTGDQRSIPCVYAIMSRKDTASYRKLFEILDELKAFREGFPKIVMTDFEKSLWVVVGEFLPWAQHVGCLWHWKRCLRTNLGERHLLALYSSSAKFHHLVSLLYALAFVPVGEVQQLYEDVVLCYIDDNRDDPETFAGQEEAVADFIAYFEKTWIGRSYGRTSRRPPLFGLETWNHYQSCVDGSSTTNNACEGKKANKCYISP